MSLFGWLKKAEPPVKPRPIARKPPVPAQSSGALSKTEEGDSKTDDIVFNDFSKVPAYSRVLSAGEHPAVNIPAAQRPYIVVIESKSPKGAQIIYVKGKVDRQDIMGLKGALHQKAMTVLPMACGTEKLIEQIYGTESAGTKGARRAENAFIEAIDEWILYAVENRATDVHIESNGKSGRVRFRIDGELETMRSENGGQYPSDFLEKCMASLFNNEQETNSGSESLFLKDKMLYCMVPYNRIQGVSLKLRYQSVKGNGGPKVILRLLSSDESAPTLSFEDLGYETSQIVLWRQAQQAKSGACLISGITGSGKSTTQKSFIELDPDLEKSAIYTVEDPIEYPLRGAHQVPLQRDLTNEKESSRKYNEVMGALMRGDLDSAMVGEIRDADSANALVQIAESGHFAMATVHAHLLTGIVPRLSNRKLGLSREVLCAPNILTLLVYQALVPILCSRCSLTSEEAAAEGEDKPKDEEVGQYLGYVRRIGLDETRLRWKNIGGCEHCKHRGTVGQTVVAEMVIPSKDWLTATRESRDADAMTIYQKDSDGDLLSSNMRGKTIFEHTLYKAMNGRVDVRQCNRFEIFERFVESYLAARGK